MAGADMDPSQYTYALDRLSAQDKARLWCSVSSLWPIAPQWPTMPQPCPQWPNMAPYCPPGHLMWAQQAPVGAPSGTLGPAPAPSCLTELQHSSSCVTGGQEAACNTPSLQHRLSIDAVGGCASSCGTATGANADSKDGSSTPQPDCKALSKDPCEDDGDHLFQLFDVFSEEDMASSLVSSNDSMTTGVLNNASMQGITATTGIMQELPMQPSAAAMEPAVASPALPPSPPSSAPSSEVLPQLLPGTMPHPAYHLSGCASDTLTNPITSAASIPAKPTSSNPMAPAASVLVPGAVVTLGCVDNSAGGNKPARTASMPAPNSPAASTSRVKSGGVKKPSQDAAARRKVQAAAAVAACKGSKGSSGTAPTFLGGSQPSIVRGVGVSAMMSLSAFAPFAMDPIVGITPTTLSGGVFTAAAIMSLNEAVEEDHATDVLLTTNSSMCPALSWMEDVTLQAPAANLAA